MSALEVLKNNPVQPFEKIHGGFFDPMQHVYYDEDMMRVPGTTSLLEAAGLVCYQHIPPRILRHKAEIGTAAHAAAHYYDEGDLDEASVDPEVHPYVLRKGGWTTFRQETKFKPQRIEFRMVGSIAGFKVGGTLDRTGSLLKRDSLLEIKCTANVEASWGPQTAMYDMILRQIEGRKEFYQRVVTWLRPTSNYKLILYNDVQDYQIAKLTLRCAYETDLETRHLLFAVIEKWMNSKGKGYVYPDSIAE